MNYETLVEAKTRLSEIGALWGIGVASVLLMAGAVLVFVGLVGFRKNAGSEWPIGVLVIGGVMAFISLLVLPIHIYLYNTADLRARADLANYNLIEVKK